MYMEETEVERMEGWAGGRLGEGCILTRVVQKREGYSYIVIHIHLVGANENLGFAHGKFN